MPLIVLIPACIISLMYLVWKKVNIKTCTKRILNLIICTVTWISIVYQFVSVAHYIDESGAKIADVIGRYGLSLSWIGLIIFSVYLVYIYIDYFGNKIE